MAPAISVTNLGKMYRLSHQGKRTDSFREVITSALMSPLRRLRQIHGTDETMEEFWALKDVSFDVQPGEVVGIIGRNGAGKSTLLKILSRIVDPTFGEIVLRGRVASLLEVGTGFHPELTGRENMYLNGSILGMKKREIDRKFDEIVDFAEVEKFLDTPVKRYSSGMYVRLAFAVAAHLDPEILIVDEVLAVGDAEFQKKCLGKMKEVATGSGRTVLFVSHNMAAIDSLCDTAIMLAGGSVKARGDCAEVIKIYKHAVDELPSNSFVQFKRPPETHVWMTSAQLKVNGSPSSNIPMDADVSLEVMVQSDNLLSAPKILVVIHSQDGYRILHTSNRFCPTIALSGKSHLGKMDIQLGRLPLTPSRYSISFHLEVNGRSQHSSLESLIFDIEACDVTGQGWVPNSSNSPVWWRANYEFSAISEESQLNNGLHTR
jgi:lipopolysaccharide transport system ATP-binding protein